MLRPPLPMTMVELGLVVDLRRDRGAGQLHLGVGADHGFRHLGEDDGPGVDGLGVVLEHRVAQLLGMGVVVAADAEQVAARQRQRREQLRTRPAARGRAWRAAASPATAASIMPQRAAAAIDVEELDLLRRRRDRRPTRRRPSWCTVAMRKVSPRVRDGLDCAQMLPFRPTSDLDSFATMDAAAQPARDHPRQAALPHLACRPPHPHRTRAERGIRPQPQHRAARAAGLQAQAPDHADRGQRHLRQRAGARGAGRPRAQRPGADA